MSIYENVVYPLRVDGERRKQVLDEVVERSLKSAALWNEVDGGSATTRSGFPGPAAAAVHRAGHRGRTRGASHGRTLFGARPLATSKIEELMQELRGTYSIVIVTHNMQQAAA